MRAAVMVAAALLCGMAAAHHSFATFDLSREVVVVGQVKQFQWSNPHTWIQLLVRDDRGQVTEWSIETQSVNVLSKLGWTHDTVKVGDRVTVTLNPSRNEGSKGNLVSITLPGGRTLRLRRPEAASSAASSP